MHGGQDFELGALMVLTVLCLALVLPKHSSQWVHSLFTRSHRAGLCLTRSSLGDARSAWMILVSRTKPASDAFNIPLQI